MLGNHDMTGITTASFLMVDYCLQKEKYITF